MAGMQLLGAAAFLDGLDDMKDAFAAGDGGYRVGTPVRYAPHQEFGTAYQDGTPHFRPGFDATMGHLPRLEAQASSIKGWMRLVALRWQAEAQSRAPVDSGTLRASYTVEEF